MPTPPDTPVPQKPHPFAHYSDSAFPIVHGWKADQGLMITLPHRGNGLEVECLSCGHTVWFGGQDIVIRFADWLPRTVGDWSRSLRCQCGSRRITVGALNDPGASGFVTSPADTGPTIWARRLAAWLAEIGRDIRDYRDVLDGLPIEGELRKVGL